MAFVDELSVRLRAGHGGDGVVRWRHEKNKDKGGPSGGNGGRGGSLYACAVSDIGLLARYRGTKEFSAGDGENGKENLKHGADGEDFILDVPIGSIVKNLLTGEEFDLSRAGDRVLLLAGGKGGLGNARFKGSAHQRPEEWTPGEKGEEADFDIELRLIADAGLIGLPNAGKSSLLNTLTRANARIGAYAFTTLEPNLGAFQGFILADIPGLIEGAASGKGLGHKFLRHIKRTKALFHCISLEHEDPEEAYRTVRKELELYNPELIEKPELLVLTKSDTVDTQRLAKASAWALTHAEHVYVVSVLDDDSIERFSKGVVQTLGALSK